MKNIILYGLLLVGFINTVIAQEAPEEDPIKSFTLVVDPNYYPTGYDKFGAFGKTMVGFGNLFLGIGSFISGEPRDGFKLMLYYGVGGGMAVGGYFLAIFGYEMLMHMGWEILLILPAIIPLGAITLGVFGVVAGTYTVVRTFVDGFLYPYRLGSPPSGKRSIDSPYKFPNVNVALVPQPDGKASTQVSYTLHF